MKFSANALEILFEDNHLLAVNKPAGLLTQPNDTAAPDLETLAKAYLKEKYRKQGNVFLHPIHRLDKPVSGIVLFARTSKALSRLNAQMRERSIEKTYTALIEGLPSKKTATLEHLLVHASHRAYISPNGKLARLTYRLLETFPKAALVEINLHTGRYHQIRAQFSHIGHPLVGDAKYGAQEKSGPIALHHTKLSFIHPITNLKQTLMCQPTMPQNTLYSSHSKN